jgi:hypothetical protein
MRPPIKRVGRAPSKNDAATVALTKSTPAQAVVQKLEYLLAELDRLPLPIGKLGCQFLDALELCDQIRTKVREKAKELLLKKPGAIPGRRVSGQPPRTRWANNPIGRGPLNARRRPLRGRRLWIPNLNPNSATQANLRL